MTTTTFLFERVLQLPRQAHATRQAAVSSEPRGQRFALGSHARRRETTGLRLEVDAGVCVLGLGLHPGDLVLGTKHFGVTDTHITVCSAVSRI